MIVERIQDEPQLSEAPAPSRLPATRRTGQVSPVTAMKRSVATLGIVAVGSCLFAWQQTSKVSQYEAIMLHTSVMHADPLGTLHFDDRIKDCTECGVKVKSVGGR